jgi:dihydroorotate dehydrogenase electron transfer subunit
VLVVAAGTPAEQARVAAAAAEAGVRCLVPTQPAMACGIGVCWTCAVPVADGAPVRACLDGPVLDAARLTWPEPAVAR